MLNNKKIQKRIDKFNWKHNSNITKLSERWEILAKEQKEQFLAEKEWKKEVVEVLKKKNLHTKIGYNKIQKEDGKYFYEKFTGNYSSDYFTRNGRVIETRTPVMKKIFL